MERSQDLHRQAASLVLYIILSCYRCTLYGLYYKRPHSIDGYTRSWTNSVKILKSSSALRALALKGDQKSWWTSLFPLSPWASTLHTRWSTREWSRRQSKTDLKIGGTGWGCQERMVLDQNTGSRRSSPPQRHFQNKNAKSSCDAKSCTKQAWCKRDQSSWGAEK